MYVADIERKQRFSAWMQKMKCALKSCRQILNHVRATEIGGKEVRFQGEEADLPTMLENG